MVKSHRSREWHFIFTIDSAIPKTARVATAITRPCTQTVRNRAGRATGPAGREAAASSHRGCWIDGEGEGGKPVCHQIDPENVDRGLSGSGHPRTVLPNITKTSLKLHDNR